MAGGSRWWGDGFSIRSTHGCLEWTCSQDGKHDDPASQFEADSSNGWVGIAVVVLVTLLGVFL